LAAAEPERFVVLDTTRELAAVQADVVTLAQQLISDSLL
jgi:thymidylate kinase